MNVSGAGFIPDFAVALFTPGHVLAKLNSAGDLGRSA